MSIAVKNNVLDCLTMPWEELRDYSYNDLKDRKDREVEKLKNSILNGGFCFPMIIWAEGNYVIDGAGRKEALDELWQDGYELPEIPYIRISAKDLTTAKELALYASSRHGEITQKSFDAFISDLDIQRLVDEINLPEIRINLADDDDVEHLESDDAEDDAEDYEPQTDETQPGDIYEIGDHTLVCGDATSIDDVQKLLQGVLPDLIFTDPPYNVGYKVQRGTGAKANKAGKKLREDEAWDVNFDPQEFLAVLTMILAPDCSVYICTSHVLFGQMVEWMEQVLDYSAPIVWHKPNPMPSINKRHWTSSVELIAHGTRGKHTFNFPKQGHALNMWSVNKIAKATYHPTQKPVDVPRTAILHSTIPGMSVLDLFSGSGSTLMACQTEGRIGYALEINPKYCDVTLERFRREYPDLPIRRNGAIM